MSVFAAIFFADLEPRVGLGEKVSLLWLAGCHEVPINDWLRVVRAFFVRDYGDWFNVVQAADKAVNEVLGVPCLFFFDVILLMAFSRLRDRSPGVSAASVNETPL